MAVDDKTVVPVQQFQNLDDDLKILACLRNVQFLLTELDRARRHPDQVSDTKIEQGFTYLSANIDDWALRLEKRIDSLVREHL